MTDQSQQEFSIDEVMAQAAARFGGGDYQTAKQEEEPQDPAPVEPVEPAPVEPQDPAPVEKTEPAAPVESAPTEPAAPVIDPMLKALLDANNPAPVEPAPVEPQSPAPVEKTEPVAPVPKEAPVNSQIKTIQPNDLLTDGARKFLQEYKDLDEQSFNVMDLMAEAHSKAQVHNLEQAVVQVVQQLQGQIAQQNQIINELKNQLVGMHTKVTAPTLDADIAAMKADPLVAAYLPHLPYMQNILNGQDINAKMQLVNTWKSSKSTTNSAQPSAPVTQAPVVERRTSSVSAAAEATAALANKTQGSMVQPSDPIEEGMRLAQERFGLNRK